MYHVLLESPLLHDTDLSQLMDHKVFTQPNFDSCIPTNIATGLEIQCRLLVNFWIWGYPNRELGRHCGGLTMM